MVKTLSVALFLAAAAGAAEQTAPLCPEGARPLFTAHPFRVWSCPPKDLPAPNDAPPPVVLDRADKAADLKALVGEWKGLVAYGGQRYEVRLKLRAKGRGVGGEWSVKDYHTHAVRTLKGRLSPVWFDKGHLRGSVESAHFQPLLVDAYAGKPSSATAAGYERQLVWTLEGLGDRHDVRYAAPQPDGIRFEYRHFPARGTAPSGASGRLARVD